MTTVLEVATEADVDTVMALRNAATADLNARCGRGPWSRNCTARGILNDMRYARIYVARENGAAIATLRLATKKPWAINRAYFTPCRRPLYLTSMAVAPEHQRRGWGRRCLAEAAEIARSWPAEAIWLDAFDHESAGAREFYRKCGYREVGRTVFHGVALRYYEMRVNAATAP